jgi:hypothetical protein
MAFGPQYSGEFVDQRAFSCAWSACDSDDARASGVREKLLQKRDRLRTPVLDRGGGAS